MVKKSKPTKITKKWIPISDPLTRNHDIKHFTDCALKAPELTMINGYFNCQGKFIIIENNNETFWGN